LFQTFNFNFTAVSSFKSFKVTIVFSGLNVGWMNIVFKCLDWKAKPDSVGINLPNFDSFFARKISITWWVNVWYSYLKRSYLKVGKNFLHVCIGMYLRQIRALKLSEFLLYSYKAFEHLNITLSDQEASGIILLSLCSSKLIILGWLPHYSSLSFYCWN
jgi:hypothetical protein